MVCVNGCVCVCVHAQAQVLSGPWEQRVQQTFVLCCSHQVMQLDGLDFNYLQLFSKHNKGCFRICSLFFHMSSFAFFFFFFLSGIQEIYKTSVNAEFLKTQLCRCRGQWLVLPAMKCEQLDGAWCLTAPRTRRDPGSEQWPFCHIYYHRNQACSGRWAPQQPRGTGHYSGTLIGRTGWSAARSLVEGSHRTAHWRRSRLNRG